jgi:YidC/Oxa1 family membrane protein insertase
MEEKKFDVQSLIGFLLIGVILIWMLYNNSFEQEAVPAEENTIEQVETTPEVSPIDPASNLRDTTALVQAQKQLGAFGYSAALPSATDEMCLS